MPLPRWLARQRPSLRPMYSEDPTAARGDGCVEIEMEHPCSPLRRRWRTPSEKSVRTARGLKGMGQTLHGAHVPLPLKSPHSRGPLPRLRASPAACRRPRSTGPGRLVGARRGRRSGRRVHGVDLPGLGPERATGDHRLGAMHWVPSSLGYRVPDHAEAPAALDEEGPQRLSHVRQFAVTRRRAMPCPCRACNTRSPSTIGFGRSPSCSPSTIGFGRSPSC